MSDCVGCYRGVTGGNMRDKQGREFDQETGAIIIRDGKKETRIEPEYLCATCIHDREYPRGFFRCGINEQNVEISIDKNFVVHAYCPREIKCSDYKRKEN